ncbi:TPA: hypothetical protein DCQ44_00850, partial [Candidatus Taylorbacteria bacterium]|nr:hypothetical protein [Candidatus Taylorbacteria bacterium]
MCKHEHKEPISFWLLLYPFAIVACFVLLVFRLVGLIKVRGAENFPKKKKGLLIVSPHMSFWEPAALHVLINPIHYFFHPVAIPWSTPDKEGLYDKWFWLFFRPRSVPVSRRADNKREAVKALNKIIELLQMKHNVILFPEGTRKHEAKDCIKTPSGKNCIGKLKNGVGSIICRSGCVVVIVWFERVWW